MKCVTCYCKLMTTETGYYCPQCGAMGWYLDKEKYGENNQTDRRRADKILSTDDAHESVRQLSE